LKVSETWLRIFSAVVYIWCTLYRWRGSERLVQWN